MLLAAQQKKMEFFLLHMNFKNTDNPSNVWKF